MGNRSVVPEGRWVCSLVRRPWLIGRLHVQWRFEFPLEFGPKPLTYDFPPPPVDRSPHVYRSGEEVWMTNG